ncbi:ATP-dependent RNA helicase DHX36-like [Pyrus ussuriensis x Pyrus communis]|uniref:ATP-dependent RNA helicase DHX36-like n=1 Tax=Pyrus ussuriensis x Pyrus communis TaxID=2448454 RepID=A0A5N5G635_9ROSA|nr:ATP-dependent RNA helicase DHX36-like [Pyrus ussuriensis x Pyrus communis]
MAKKKKKHSQVDEPTKNRLLNALQPFNVSTDEGEQQCISVTHPVTRLTFSEGTKEVLSDLFIRYPPCAHVEDLEVSGKSSDKNESAQMEEGHKVLQALDEQGRNCKEVASLASKIKNNVDL